MDYKYFLGIPELDAEHAQIFVFLSRLQEALDEKQPRQVTGPVLQRLKDLLVAHFAHEESFMDVIACVDRSEHRTKHQELLQVLDNYIGSLSSPDEAEGTGKKFEDLVHAHVVEFDNQIVETVKCLIDTIREHEVPNKSQ